MEHLETLKSIEAGTLDWDRPSECEARKNTLLNGLMQLGQQSLFSSKPFFQNFIALSKTQIESMWSRYIVEPESTRDASLVHFFLSDWISQLQSYATHLASGQEDQVEQFESRKSCIQILDTIHSNNVGKTPETLVTPETSVPDASCFSDDSFFETALNEMSSQITSVPVQEKEKPPEMKTYVGFERSGIYYIVPVDQVLEIYPTQVYVEYPVVTDMVRGVTRFRGEPLWLLDPFGKSQKLPESMLTLVSEIDGQRFGVIVEKVDQVTQILNSKLQDLSLGSMGGSTLKKGITRLHDEARVLVDFAPILKEMAA